jgi:membrane protein DedA with SNARE-associated domain
VLSSVIGATLNYYFVRTWGERALAHFHEKHLAKRDRMNMREGAIEAEVTGETPRAL